MEKPSTKKPMNILKTMVFLNNFMKKTIEAGDTLKLNLHIKISMSETITYNEDQLKQSIEQTIRQYFDTIKANK